MGVNFVMIIAIHCVDVLMLCDTSFFFPSIMVLPGEFLKLFGSYDFWNILRGYHLLRKHIAVYILWSLSDIRNYQLALNHK